MKPGRFIGAMSGTSLDGADVVLATIDETMVTQQASLTWPIPIHVKQAILDICQGQQLILSQFSQLDVWFDYLFAEAMNALLVQKKLKLQGITAIGCHGQTVWHEPNGAVSHTLQIGDSNQIVTRIGITVVGDFRRRDVALGGQGTPLVPAFCQALLVHPMERRMVLNIGETTNLFLLIPQQPVRGYNTGPGNMLVDAWVWRQCGQSYDKDVQWVISGTMILSLLQNMLNDPYFSASAPKDIDHEYPNYGRVERHLAQFPGISPRDVQVMLTKLMTVTISEQILLSDGCDRLMACDGGSHDPPLMMRLAASLPGIEATSIDEAGVSGDDMETLVFVWLAWRVSVGLPGNLSFVTGASESSVLGAVYPASL